MPAVGVRIAVDDEGEVLARSNHVFAGYWEQPAETEAALEGGWFHTGDGGYVDDDAYLVISDRKKDVIITGGENVSSIEVEDCLYQHAAVAEVAVIGVPDERWGETVTALVVLRPGETVDEDELDRALPRPHGALQGAAFRRVPPGARPHGDGQAAEVQAAPALLGRARAWGQLSAWLISGGCLSRPGGASSAPATPANVPGLGGQRTGRPSVPRAPAGPAGRRRPPPHRR